MAAWVDIAGAGVRAGRRHRAVPADRSEPAPWPGGGGPRMDLRLRRADYLGIGVYLEAVPGIHWRGGR